MSKARPIKQPAAAPAPACNIQPDEAGAIEDIELPLLLEAIYRRYGYDFRDYAQASLRRRLHTVLTGEGLPSLSALQERLLHDRECMARLLETISVGVSAMFRDPAFYKALRDKVVPALRDLPLIRVWHAGCSTGEEVYSLAILLREEGLLDKARLYATDISDSLLGRAQEAIFPLKHMQEYTSNYQKAGGKGDFSAYYSAKHGGAILHNFLRANIVWASHNLVCDASFNEFHLILYRNVMIYFNRQLQERVHQLIYDSLAPGGVLGLGHGESLQFTPHQDRYEVVDAEEKLYRRVR